jgi:predicted nucleic-acid-binding protein
MIAVDTNILVRVVTNDNAAQAKRAAALLTKERIFIPKTVILEMEWVLRYAYGLERSSILKAFQGILGLPNVQAEDAPNVSQALNWYESGLDFADALHLASGSDSGKFVTFDDKLCKKAKKIKQVRITCI